MYFKQPHYYLRCAHYYFTIRTICPGAIRGVDLDVTKKETLIRNRTQRPGTGNRVDAYEL